MYYDFFGLNSAPFAIAPDPNYLYMSPQHRDALAHLIYGIQGNGGFVMLTGDIGTGKTTLCRCMFEHLPDNTDIAFILNPTLNSEELLASICDELHIEYNNDQLSIKNLSDAIYHHLLKSHAANRNTLLIIDEAQNLGSEVLEQMRLLTNLETSDKKLLQIVMFGQPELRQLINQPELKQLSQRITARFHLEALRLEDTEQYIEHRLGVAGYKQKANQISPLPKNLYRQIHHLSGGIPRLINILCDRALLGAYARNEAAVSSEILYQAAYEVFGIDKPKKKNNMSLVAPGTAILATVFCVLLVLKFVPDSEQMIHSYIAQMKTAFSEQTQPAPASTDNQLVSDTDSNRSASNIAVTPSASAATNDDSELQQSVASESIQDRVTRSDSQQPNHPVQSVTQQASISSDHQPMNHSVAATDPMIAENGVTSAQTPMSQTSSEADQPLRENSPKNDSESPVGSQAKAQTASFIEQQPTEPSIEQKNQVVESASTPIDNSSAPVDTVQVLATDTQLADPYPEFRAYQSLFMRWNLNLSATTDPCSFAISKGLRCLHQQGSWQQLKKTNRPALIRVINKDGLVSSLALLSIGLDSALLSDGRKELLMPIEQLEKLRIISHTLLWKPPQGYKQYVKLGDTGPAVLWLKKQMAQLSPMFQSEINSYFDPQLSLYVKAFQRSQNLLQDGAAGPQTLIQLNTLLAEDVPVLLSATGA